MADLRKLLFSQHHYARVGLVTAIALLTSACGNNGRDRSPEPLPTSSKASDPVPDLLVQPEALGRSDLLKLIRVAADATAAGSALPAASRQLIGRNFEITLPFGCPGESKGHWAGWTFDPVDRVLRLTATSQRWDSRDWLARLTPNQQFEAAEGFWIERPWTSSEKCGPKVAAEPSSRPSENPPARNMPEPFHTAAIAEFFAADAARTAQRSGRPYAFTVKAPDFDPQSPHDFRLRLQGRIAGFEDGQPVHCLNANPALPPQCVVAVEFASVAFEVGLTGELVKEWRR